MATDQNSKEPQGLTNENRKTIVSDFAPFLRSNQRDKVLAACKGFKFDHERVAIIAALAGRLTVDQRADALEIIETFRHPQDRATAFIDLAPYLTPGEHAKARGILISKEKMIGRKEDQLFYDAMALAHLAWHANDTERAKLVPALERIPDDRARAAGLQCVATFLNDAEPELIQEAIRSAKKITDEFKWQRAKILTDLVDFLDESERTAFIGEVTQAVSVMAKATSTGGSAAEDYAITSFPKLGRFLSPEQIDDALKTININIGHRLGCADAILALAKYLSPTQIDEALSIVNKAVWDKDRANGLVCLTRHSSGNQRERVLAAFNKFHACGELAAAYVQLSEFLVEDHDRLIRSAVQIARLTYEEHLRALALLEVALHIPRQRAELLGEAVEIAERVSSPFDRLCTFMKIVPHVDSDRRGRVVGGVLEAAKDYINQWGRVDTYTRLARQLAKSDPSDELLGYVLTALLTETSGRPFKKNDANVIELGAVAQSQIVKRKERPYTGRKKLRRVAGGTETPSTQQVGPPSAIRTDARGIPLKAPATWAGKRNSDLTIDVFFRKWWARYLKKGLTFEDIKRLDPKLGNSLKRHFQDRLPWPDDLTLPNERRELQWAIEQFRKGKAELLSPKQLIAVGRWFGRKEKKKIHSRPRVRHLRPN